MIGFFIAGCFAGTMWEECVGYQCSVPQPGPPMLHTVLRHILGAD